MGERRRGPIIPPKHPRRENPSHDIPHPSIIEEQQRRREPPRQQPEIPVNDPPR